MTNAISAVNTNYNIPQIRNNNNNGFKVVANNNMVDEFIKTQDAMIVQKIAIDGSLAKDDKNLIDVLQAEYDAIVEENFETKEEYEAAKEKAYQRLQDAIQNANDRSNERHRENTNCFTKIIDSIGNFMKNVGIGIIEYFFPKGPKIPTP